MDNERLVLDRLRLTILGGMHVGRLHPGDRLPSIRQVARDTGTDHRVVARAYEQLERELIVEVRGRSGVFVRSGTTRANLQAGRKHWVSTILQEAWGHRISISEATVLLERCSQHGLRCLCLEATIDHMVAFSSELSSDFGFTPHCQRLPSGDKISVQETKELLEQARNTDIAVTTSFHYPLVRRILGDEANIITVAVNPALRDELKRRLDEQITIVIADPLFAERIHLYASQLPASGSKVKIVYAADVDPSTLPEESTLYTRAARRALGLGEYHLLSGNIPFISPESAAALCDFIVNRVLER